MKTFLFFLFIVNFALANSFELKNTSSRFKLQITKTFLFYGSEQIQKKVELKACNSSLAQNLNEQLLSFLPKENTEKGIPFFVDAKELLVKANSAKAKKILSMDQRMMEFFLEERRVCAL